MASRLPVSPYDPVNNPVDARLAAKSAAYAAAQAPAQSRLPVDRTVTGTAADAKTFGPNFQARYDASQAAGAAATAAATPAPMSQQTGFALGNAIRADNIAAANAAALRPAQNPSMAAAQANAAAGQTALAGRIQYQQDAAAAYQKNVNDAAAKRQSNIAAARKDGTFDKTREEYNEAHGATHLMDSAGDIHQLNDASRLKIAADTAKRAAAETKLAHTTQMAHATTINDKLKEAVGAQKAAEAEKAGSPQAVSQNIAGLFGATFTPEPSLEPTSALTGFRTNDVAIQAPAAATSVAPATNPIFNPQTGGPLRNALRAGGRVASLFPLAAKSAFEASKKAMDVQPFATRLP